VQECIVLSFGGNSHVNKPTPGSRRHDINSLRIFEFGKILWYLICKKFGLCHSSMLAVHKSCICICIWPVMKTAVKRTMSHYLSGLYALEIIIASHGHSFGDATYGKSFEGESIMVFAIMQPTTKVSSQILCL